MPLVALRPAPPVMLKRPLR